ncbi:MAG: tetratricopeptide repeat protein [Gemmataceae bacterium]
MLPRWLQLLYMVVQNVNRGDAAPRRATAPPVIPSPPAPPPPASTMRFLQTEYLLKGVYLGLVLFAALTLATLPTDPGGGLSAAARDGLVRVNVATLVGLGLALLVAAALRFRDAVGAHGRLLAFVLFLLLETPTLVYTGILAGSVVGLYLLRGGLAGLDVERQEVLQQLFIPVIGGAAAAGLAFGLLRQVRDRLARLVLVLVLAGGLAAAGLSWLGLIQLSWISPSGTYALEDPTAFALQLLLGIPFFYLLTFAGVEEESEIEIGAMCGLLGVSLSILLAGNKQLTSLAFLLPIALYVLYTLQVLPGLRVLKHAFRGLSYSRVGRHRRALLAFRRALQLDPNNRLARGGFWEVHRSLDLDKLANDPETLALVDLDLCLDRAGSLLLSKPNAVQLDEANRLLALVMHLAPRRQPQVSYWRAVAATHAGRVDDAARELERVLDPHAFGADNPHRQAILLSAWQLALLLHDGLRQRVGLPQLAVAGRRVEAIGAVERHLAESPNDPAVVPLKKLLYQDLTEADYNAGAGGDDLAAPHVDHAYLQHLGLALINDEERWQRGGEYLRLAARGLPALGPTLFVHIAQAMQRVGRLDETRHNYELARRAGLAVGPKNLDQPERDAYFATVKYLGEEALGRDDVDAALENFRLYSESERSGIETLRTLAGLYERKGNPLAAARAVDQALQYNAKDPDLLARKDKYYYSVLPSDLQARLEQYGPGFDVAYCINRARTILQKYDDLEWLDVAFHLAQLALVVQPDSRVAKLLLARLQQRLGERDKAVALLEEVRGPARPDKFPSEEDEEAWYQASQLLGDLYLETDRADLAVACLNDFRKSSKSGARTLFKLGQAYEQLGDKARAMKCYEQVTAYETNPLVPEAQDALYRLKG